MTSSSSTSSATTAAPTSICARTEPGGAKVTIPQSAFLLPDGYDYDGALATTVQPDGRTLRLDFARELAAPRPPSSTTTSRP